MWFDGFVLRPRNRSAPLTRCHTQEAPSNPGEKPVGRYFILAVKGKSGAVPKLFQEIWNTGCLLQAEPGPPPGLCHPSHTCPTLAGTTQHLLQLSKMQNFLSLAREKMVFRLLSSNGCLDVFSTSFSVSDKQRWPTNTDIGW